MDVFIIPFSKGAGGAGVTAEEYYNRLIPYYRAYYDIEEPYILCDTECLAHGHFFSHNEKYVLSREARLWESNNFEHVFFIRKESLESEDLAKMDRMIKEHVEPVMVRNGKKYPEKDHMYTYITFVFFSGSPLEKEIIKRIKKYHFARNYLFSFRGFCEVKVAVVDVSGEKLYTNRSGASLKKLYKKLFRETNRSLRKEERGGVSF